MGEHVRRTRAFSLSEFCDQAKDLYESDDISGFTRFVLCGHLNNEQAAVDVNFDRVDDEDLPDIEITRDYDSMLGIDPHVRVRRRHLMVWPVPKYTETLTTSLHFKYSFKNNEGPQRCHLHQIPNIGLGKWGTHNLLRIFFLDLHSDQRKSHKLTSEEEATFYDKGLRPTLRDLLEGKAGVLPPDHEAEMFMARQANGRYAFSSIVLPHWQMPYFANVLRQHLAESGVRWAQHIVFLHQLRGLKNGTTHTANDADAAKDALEAFLNEMGLDLEELLDGEGQWWIDAGLEFSSRSRRCLAFRTSKHPTLVQEVASISESNANRITQITSSKCYVDPASHLPGAAGVRITPGTRAQGPFEIAYLQAYLTDKAVTYRPEAGRHGKSITPLQLIDGKGAQYFTDLYHLYRTASDSNFSSARIEVRVPIKHATSVLLGVDLEHIAKCLAVFPRVTWWDLRIWRVLAFKMVNDWQMSANPENRMLEPALQLTAGIAWMANGLHSTPDIGPSSRELMNAILPRIRRADAEKAHLPYPISLSVPEEEEEEEEEVGDDYGEFEALRSSDAFSAIHDAEEQRNPDEDEDEDGDEDEYDDQTSVVLHPAGLEDGSDENSELPSLARSDALIPVVQHGLYFFRELKLGPAIPRLVHRKIHLSDKALRWLFGKPLHELHMQLLRSQVILPRNPTRSNNKRSQPLLPPPPPNAPLNFALEAAGHSLEESVVDDGSDLSDDEFRPRDQDDPLGDHGLDRGLQQVFGQFIVDTLQTCPNRGSNKDDSYCEIIPKNREKATIENYQNLNLPDTFNDVQYKIATTAEWRKVFDYLFPPKGTRKAGAIQNFKRVAYYPLWIRLTDRMSHETAKKSRKALWKLFQTFKWIPNSAIDHIWSTRPLPNTFHRFPGKDRKGPAPSILIRGGQPTWNMLG